MKEKTLLVSAIKEGTVIDHIQAGVALKIIRLLQLDANEARVTVGLNLKSRSMGLKDIIKVENLLLNQLAASQIAIFAPLATVNVIANYKVTAKHKVQMPEEIVAALRCPNLRCISNAGKVITRFKVEEDYKGAQLRCHFCERVFSKDEMRS
jgi:aspartate carbamoyltransferase regulatory subunit